MLARHVGNLGLVSGPSGLRPDLDVGEGQPIASALAAMIAYDGVTRVELRTPPKVHVWKGASDVEETSAWAAEQLAEQAKIAARKGKDR